LFEVDRIKLSKLVTKNKYMPKEEIRKLSFVDLDNQNKQTKSNHTSFDSKSLSPTQSLFKKIQLPQISLNSKNHTEEVLTLEGPKEEDFNPNFLSSIFNQDKQEAGGIARVFRKSMIFLVAQLIAFLAFITSSFFFFENPVLTIFFLVLSTAITSIFFIIVADRSYVWLVLLGQSLLLIIANSFLGLAFSPVTLVATLVSTLFYFLAYSELEKVQLSSRLFSISHITSESTRIILTATTLLLALGVFNSILWQGQRNGKDEGSKPFLGSVIFDNKLIVDNLFIGRTGTFSINQFLVGGDFFVETSGDKIMYQSKNKTGNKEIQATFGDFLENNYEFNDVLTIKEEQDFRATNCTDIGSTSEACNLRLEQEIDKKVEQWRLKAYPDLPYSIKTPLTLSNYREINKAFYLNKIAELETEKVDSGFIDESLIIVPRKTIIPALVSLMLAVILFLTRFIFSWIVFIANWIIWRILLVSGFVQIDVETVEAEIISI
jgi:hypothetical protein